MTDRMELETGDDILGQAALDGSMDYSAWPQLLPTVLARIEKIAHTEFPIPNIPSPHPAARPPSPRFLAPLPSSDPFEAPDHTGPSSSQGTNKENADPTSPSAARSAAATNPAPSSTAVSAPTQPQPPARPTLPKPIADMLDEILSVLRDHFPQYPPHTIQRLSELVLRPRQHYRNLVPYLHALDRVVHVTSGANTYPLPPALPEIGAMSLLANGAGGGGAASLSIDTAAANSIGSDDALGGALLTPIPWLARRANGTGSDDGSDLGSSSPLSASGNHAQQFQMQQQQQQQRTGGQLEGRVRTESTETIEGPNGIGSIETVSVSVNGIPSTGAGVALLTQRSVTQGELLRQEQRAGLVPLNQISRQQQQQQQQQPQADSSGAAEEDATMSETAEQDEEDEIPHARGPEEIGPADTGPQSAAAASYIAGSAGPMDVQGIDLEAAVGRRLQSPPTQQQQQQDTTTDKRASGSPVPQSPKREATDALEAESPRKRVKEDEATSATATATQDQSDSQPSADPPSETPDDQTRDAEGDAVLPDIASTTTTTAAATKDDAQAQAQAQAPPAPADESQPDSAESVEAKGDGEADNKSKKTAPAATGGGGTSDSGAETQGG